MISSVLLSVLFAQASPVPTASPSPGPLLTPPSGWKIAMSAFRSGNTAGLQQGWFKRSKSDASFLMAGSAPNFGLAQADFVKLNEQALTKSYPSMRIVADEPVAICGSHSGEEVVARVATPQGVEAKLRMLFVVLPSHGYFGMYRHRWDQPDDPAAVAALRGMCPPWESALAPVSGTPPITPPAAWASANMSAYTAKDQAAPAMWAWVGPSDAQGHTGVVMAMTMPGTQSLSSSAVSDGLVKGMSTWATSVKLTSQTTLPLCAATGDVFTFSAFYKTLPVTLEAVVAPGFPTMYTSIYMRWSGSPEDPNAVTAIKSLCPRDTQSAG